MSENIEQHPCIQCEMVKWKFPHPIYVCGVDDHEAIAIMRFEPAAPGDRKRPVERLARPRPERRPLTRRKSRNCKGVSGRKQREFRKSAYYSKSEIYITAHMI